MKHLIPLTLMLILLTGCAAPSTRDGPADRPKNEPAPVSTDTPQPNLPNPASIYCEQQGYTLETVTATDGSQSANCLFTDGSKCDEWDYYRGECGPASQSIPPTEIPTAVPIDSAAYDQGWWMYTHPLYNFSVMLPEDWVAEEVTTNDPLMNHALNLHPEDGAANIRLSFRRAGEDVLLWPTGVGQGEFIEQGTLDILGQPARRILLVCPTGEVTSIRYHGEAEDQPNITRGNIEFGIIYSMGSHCEPGLSLGGKTQWEGEMVIASLKVP